MQYQVETNLQDRSSLLSVLQIDACQELHIAKPFFPIVRIGLLGRLFHSGVAPHSVPDSIRSYTKRLMWLAINNHISRRSNDKSQSFDLWVLDS